MQLNSDVIFAISTMMHISEVTKLSIKVFVLVLIVGKYYKQKLKLRCRHPTLPTLGLKSTV